MSNDVKSYVIDKDALPHDFPTNRHDPEFWEQLGRTVATFGFLEETIGKAIFALTATREYKEEELSKAYDEWLPRLERAISDPLGNLIDVYIKSLKDHDKVKLTNRGDLEKELRSASQIRNVLCHGSWAAPVEGKSIPFYAKPNPELMIFSTAIDVAYLKQTRAHAVELICEVMNSVTHMGWRFPGSSGPGEAIFESRKP